MLDLFGEPVIEQVPTEKPKPAKQEGNPCIAVYGQGPEGQVCKGCMHLRYPINRNPKAHHWKCDLRKLSHGAATDHKVNWPSCARYEQRTEEYHGG